MKPTTTTSNHRPQPERGATMPEYALTAGLILVIAAAAVGLTGAGVNLLFLSYPN